MEINLQAKILRVIQEKEFQRVGGSANLQFNARIIAATNRDLESMIREGSFREDLYYRLRVVELTIKPLRERKEDIPDLVDHLLARINNELRRNVNKVSTETMDSLIAYNWHGNVRELENLLMAGVMRSTSDTLQLEIPQQTLQLSEAIASKPESPITGNSRPAPHFWERTLADVEKEHISAVLTAVRGHLGRACEILGVTRPTLRKKMLDYQLKDSFK